MSANTAKGVRYLRIGSPGATRLGDQSPFSLSSPRPPSLLGLARANRDPEQCRDVSVRGTTSSEKPHHLKLPSRTFVLVQHTGSINITFTANSGWLTGR